VVVLEGDGAAVGGVEVGLDSEALAGPEEVDGPVADLDVRFGKRQVVSFAEGEEVELEVGARAAGARRGASVDPDAGELRLAGGAADEMRRRRRFEIDRVCVALRWRWLDRLATQIA